MIRQFLPGTATQSYGLPLQRETPASAELAMIRKGLSYATFTGITTKALDSATGELEAIANRTGIVDLQNDRMEKGCWKKIIGKMRSGAESWPTLLWGHEWTQPVGVVTYAEERDEGLYIKGRMNLNTTRGRDAYEDIRFGTIKQMSVGFMPSDTGHRYAMENGKSVHLISEVAVWPETSFVLVAASPGSRVLSVKTGSHGFSEREEFELKILQLRLEDAVNKRLIAMDAAKRRAAQPKPAAMSPREKAIADIWARVANR